MPPQEDKTEQKDEAKLRALKREWAAARAVVIGGLILAVAVAGYFAYRQHEEMRAELPQAVVPNKIDPKLLARAELAVCSAELKQAKTINIVPAYGQLASPNLIRSAVPKRFICEAATHLTKYFIAADLLCNNLTDGRCVSVYRVALTDGTLVYSRPQ